MLTLIPEWLDAEHILTSFGPAAIWVAVAIVFIECGLLFPILPGDSLLFTAGSGPRPPTAPRPRQRRSRHRPSESLRHAPRP